EHHLLAIVAGDVADVNPGSGHARSIARGIAGAGRGVCRGSWDAATEALASLPARHHTRGVHFRPLAVLLLAPLACAHAGHPSSMPPSKSALAAAVEA